MLWSEKKNNFVIKKKALKVRKMNTVLNFIVKTKIVNKKEKNYKLYETVVSTTFVFFKVYHKHNIQQQNVF